MAQAIDTEGYFWCNPTALIVAVSFERFAKLTESDACGLLRACSNQRRGGPVAANDDVKLTDDSGQKHLFHLEAFFNGHQVLTLLVYKEPRPTNIAVSSIQNSGLQY